MSNDTFGGLNGTFGNSTFPTDDVVLDWKAWLGFASAVASAFGSTAALMVVRLSTEKEKGKPLCQRRLFFIGAWANLLCEVVLTSIALALAPLSLLAPTGGLTICFGAFFAWVGLFGVTKERFSPLEGLAMLVTLCGVVIAAISGPQPKEELTPADIWAVSERMLDWPHVIYGSSGWAVALGWTALQTFDRRFKHIRPSPHHPISAPLSGITSAWIASCEKLF
jgi:drug/metabolite transporter (DMT)-like permease